MTSQITPIDVRDLQLGVVRPGDATFQGCLVADKTRVATVPTGLCAQVCWQIRDQQGNPVDLSRVLLDDQGDPAGQIIFRFHQLEAGTGEIHQIIGTTTLNVVCTQPGLKIVPVGTGPDPSVGEVCVTLTDALVQNPGIWQVSIGVTDLNGALKVVDNGYLSVERSLFGSTDTIEGSLTVNEVRMQLRDREIENDLHGEVEFDDVEIIQSILRPIQQWNETPPDVARFSVTNFPYHYHWLNAAVANLLKISAHWYRRNKLQVSTKGGLNDDSRNRDRAYLEVAKMMDAEWITFIKTKKVEINMNLAAGSYGSPYGYGSF